MDEAFAPYEFSFLEAPKEEPSEREFRYSSDNKYCILSMLCFMFQPSAREGSTKQEAVDNPRTLVKPRHILEISDFELHHSLARVRIHRSGTSNGRFTWVSLSLSCSNFFFAMMFEAFGFSKGVPCVAEIYLSYLRAICFGGWSRFV